MDESRISRISEEDAKNMIKSNIWSPENPVHYSRLVTLRIKFWNFNMESTEGELCVFDTLANQVLDIFDKLFDLKFPINKIKTMDKYHGSDIESMNANNTSGFNGRKVMRTNEWSSHAYGMAIDINPYQNPYLVKRTSIQCDVYPEGSFSYLNRIETRPGMVEEILDVMKETVFSVWGGEWSGERIDYHHFQVSWDMIHRLSNCSEIDGKTMLASI